MTKLGATRIHTLRVRGGNEKFRALRLDTGNFSWGSEGLYNYPTYLISYLTVILFIIHSSHQKNSHFGRRL